VILVRHSLPAIDPAVDCMNWRLSAEGRARCDMLVEQLRPLAADAVYSSPEPKAFETAEILGAGLRLSVTAMADLREHDRTGVPFYTAPGEYEEHVCRLFSAPDACVFGAESATAALARFRKGMDQVLACEDRRPLVVTHGTVMSLYIAAESGVDAFAIWRQLRMPSYVIFGSANSGADPGIHHLRA
jgi:broad specificity phosphatase PhoE